MTPRRAIAIVDDDALVRSAMVSLMRSFGYDVRPFDSAAAFLAVGPEHCDCLISDIHMPQMSGLDLLRTLREAQSSLPVVLVTAFPDDTVRRRALDHGASAFLEKPCAPETILAAIENILGPAVE